MLVQIARFIVAFAAIYLTLFILLPVLFALLGGLLLFFLGMSLVTFITYHFMRWRGHLPSRNGSTRFEHLRFERRGPEVRTFHSSANERSQSRVRGDDSVIDAEFERLDD